MIDDLPSDLQFAQSHRACPTVTTTPEAVTLRAVIEAMEGPLVVARCLVWADCPCEQPCPVRAALTSIQREVEQVLDAVTIADLAAGAHRPPPPSDSTR